MLYPSVFTNNFVDDFFDDFFKAPAPKRSFSQNMMRTDVKELSDAFQMEMQLPGYDLADVQVEIKNGYLTVSANHEENRDEKDSEGKYIRKECYRGSCERSFYVGEHITKDNVKASFKNGMLELIVPKQEAVPEVDNRQFVQIEG